MAANDAKAQAREMGWVLAGSIVAFYVGDRWGMLAETHRNVAEGLASSLSAGLALDILLRPIALSLSTVPLLCGLSLFCCVWGAYAYMIGSRANVRHGDEYGTARRGTVREGMAYKDRRDPDNNIVLTKHLGIAIRPNKNVRERITARNVCVLGGTGANKTRGFVMPNLLQLRADRDMVVVDPKGTTLATCGHALLSAGIDINVFSTVDMATSDRYNPLAAIRTHAEVIDFVTCLIENTNNGRESSDPIWDNGEALFYRALLTLLLDWFDPADMTLANMVMLADLADIADEGEGDRKCPLDLLFEQIETGRKWARDDRAGMAGARGAFDPVGPSGSGGMVQVASPFRRRDGTIPARVRKPGGGHGLTASEDEALKVWHEFRHGAGKTLKSFVISSHTRLAYLSTPDVLDLLAAGDGRDEIHLERLGQVEDEWGRPLRPRVIFVVSSDFNDNLNALLSIMMWQAIYLPMSTADTRNSGRLPRPVSLVFDEFKNIGKIGSFIQTIAVVRSRNIDVAIMLQNASQLEEVYGKEGAATIRGNCATTVYLGGGRDFATAKQISEESGKETVYKYDWSRQGQGLSATSTRQRSSLARDVFDPNEVSTLPASKALVLIGDKQPIVDDKSLVWEHRNYDPTYMGMDPERAFDYLAWKEAGRPMGESLAAWEEAWFSSELPARNALRLAERELSLARHGLDGQPDPTGALSARVRFLEAHVITARARLAVAHDLALDAAGSRREGRADVARRLLEGAERRERDLERSIRDEFDGQVASEILELLPPRG